MLLIRPFSENIICFLKSCIGEKNVLVCEEKTFDSFSQNFLSNNTGRERLRCDELV